MWLCRHCYMPVGAAAPHCPRCNRRFPALTPRLLHLAMQAGLFALLLAGAVRLAWWAAVGS